MFRFFFTLLFSLCFTFHSFALESEIFIANEAAVSLISDYDVLSPGKEFSLALRFKQKPHWHVYWQNPGDSGLAPELHWQIGEEMEVLSDIQWERPDVIPLDQIINYGYNRPEVLLPVKFRLNKDFKGNALPVTLLADWLICKVDCVPYSAEFNLTIPVNHQAIAANLSIFHSSYSKQAEKLHLNATYYEKGNNILFEIPDIKFKNPFLVTNAYSITNNSLKKNFTNNSFQLEKAPEVKVLPDSIVATVLDLNNDNKSENAYEITFKRKIVPVANVQKKETGFWLALFFAFLGGIILNLMPCVFPVIAIKILEFVKLADGDEQSAKKHGLVFCAGIIVFMWLLALIIEALKLFGTQVGWGFQLQSPVFVSLIYFLFFLVGLSFLGVFDFGSGIVNKAGSIKTKSNLIGSFFNGALATLVATPCTAPFMGVALGATLSYGIFKTLLVFTALGLGMGIPYVILVSSKKAMSLLPKPGVWMERLKQLMAFPMFLVCVYLLWVLEKQIPVSFIFYLLVALILIAFFIWLIKNGNRIFAILALFLALSPLFFFPARQNVSDNNDNAYGLPYEKFSYAKVREYQRQGKAIYVDFTARWCITCQVNKKRVFSSEQIKNFFKSNDIKILVGDWTNRDKDLKKILNDFGKDSVPLNIVYSNRPELAEYEILPSLLGPKTVLEYLKKLTKGKTT